MQASKAGIDVNLCVADIGRSLDFYVELLGLELVEAYPSGPGMTHRLRFGESFVKLTDPIDPPAEVSGHQGIDGAFGFRAVTFQIDDFLPTWKAVVAAGAPVHMEHVSYPKAGIHVGMVLDPDGNVVELLSAGLRGVSNPAAHADAVAPTMVPPVVEVFGGPMAEDESARDGAVRLLLDKEAIRDVIARAVRGVDRLDADLLSSAFHPDGVDDHHGLEYSGATIGDELTDAQRRTMLTTSMHLTTQTIRVDGDRAGVESYYLGVHRPSAMDGGLRLISSGRMLDELERRGGEWRITRREVLPDMARCFPIDDELLVGDQPSRRDRSDPSYRVVGGWTGRPA